MTYSGAYSPQGARFQSRSYQHPQRWSVDEFHDLSRQQLIGMDGLVELVQGEVCLLPTDESLIRQIKLLQYQIQQHLDDTVGDAWDSEGIEVRSRHPIRINQFCELRPAIAVAMRGDVQSSVSSQPCEQWVIDITHEGLNQPHTGRSQLFAQANIADYWALTVSQAELRTYQGPQTSGYQQCQLLQVGDRATPTALPQITLQLQEPLPLYFLTRTLRHPRAYPTAALPLRVCPIPEV